MKNVFLITLLLMSCVIGSAQSEIVGKWNTIDEHTGKVRAVVEIFKKGENYAGTIIQTFPELGKDPDPICTKCQGEDKDQKIIGMEIIRDMVFDDEEWVDGTILDAEEGKLYDCKLWIEDGELKVRGYIAFFYRTQTWRKFEG